MREEILTAEKARCHFDKIPNTKTPNLRQNEKNPHYPTYHSRCGENRWNAELSLCRATLDALDARVFQEAIKTKYTFTGEIS